MENYWSHTFTDPRYWMSEFVDAGMLVDHIECSVGDIIHCGGSEMDHFLRKFQRRMDAHSPAGDSKLSIT